VARRVVAVLFAIVAVAASAFGALLAALYGFGLQCDESCDSGGSWRDDPGAWEWQLFGWVGIVCLAAALVLLTAVAAGLSRLAAVALVAWLVSAVTYGVLITRGLSADGALAAIVLLLVGAAAVGSVLLSLRPSASSLA
jgi:hypothetical protein